MNLKHQRLTIDLINIVMQFLLAYLLIVILLYQIDSRSALHALFLLPAPFLSYLIKKYTHHIWSFLILHGVIMTAYLILITELYLLLVTFIYLFLLIVMNYYKKSKTDSLNNTSALLLSLFVLYYTLCHLGGLPELMPLCFALSIVYALLYIANRYLLNLEKFVFNHEWITNVPFRQIRSSNNVMIVFLSSLFLVMMLLFSLVPLDRLLLRIGKLLLQFLRFLFSLLRFEEPEDIVEPEEDEPIEIEDFPIMDPSRLMELIFTILQWVATILIAVLIIALILYVIYHIYQYFYLKSEETIKDRIEFLTPFMRKERVEPTHKKTLRNYFGRSTNAQIRKHFAQAVTAGLATDTTPDQSLTPSQLSGLILPKSVIEDTPLTEKRKLITDYYEKARYSNEECSRDEVRTLKKLLKK